MNPLTFILCMLLVVAVLWAVYVMGGYVGMEYKQKSIQQQLDAWAAEHHRDRVVLRDDESDEKRQR